MRQATYPYEILIRLNSAGVTGAHYQSMTDIIADDDVTVLTSIPGEVLPLALIDDDGYPLQNVLGEALAIAMNENAALKNEVATLLNQVAQLQAALAPQP